MKFHLIVLLCVIAAALSYPYGGYPWLYGGKKGGFGLGKGVLPVKAPVKVPVPAPVKVPTPVKVPAPVKVPRPVAVPVPKKVPAPVAVPVPKKVPVPAFGKKGVW